MKLLNSIILFVGLSFVFYLVGCGDDTISSIDKEQISADSLEQSIEDNILIDDYLGTFDLHADSIRVDSTTGVRYAILKTGNGTTPNLNDIISIHYAGRFLSDTIFDTSKKSIALLQDSIAYSNTYASNDSTFEEIIAYSNTDYNLTYEETVDSLNKFKNDINFELYFESRIFQPITFNHTTNGSGISGYILGFSRGLNKLMNLKSEGGNLLFETGGKGLIIIPSAQAYGTTGNSAIPENTVLIFEFDFVNIRN